MRSLETKRKTDVQYVLLCVRLLTLVFVCGFCVGACLKAVTKANEPPSMYVRIGGEEKSFRSFPVEWSFRCTFPESFKHEIRFSFQYWDDLTDVELFSERPCGTTTRKTGIVVDAVDLYFVDGPRPQNTLGYVWRSFGEKGVLSGGLVLYFRPWLRSDSEMLRENAAIHEVGHLLGLIHGNDPDCSMYPFMDSPSTGDKYSHQRKHVCKGEISEFERHYGEGRQVR